MIKPFLQKKASLLVLLSLVPVLLGTSLPLQGASQSDLRLAKSMQQAFIDVAETATPAVVNITSEVSRQRNQGGYGRSPLQYDDPFDFFSEELRRYFEGQRSQPRALGRGTGFFIREEGYILTNNHVVDGADKITVTLADGREFQANLVGQDPNTDVAVIKVDGDGFDYIELADSDDLQVGQWVIAIGNALGTLQASVTVGVLSAKGRNNLNIAKIEDFLQTDAAINRGNSGGPLLDIDGKAIGMNTAIASNTGGSMGIGFAVPSNIAKAISEQIIDTGYVTRGFLGIQMQPVDKGAAEYYGLDKVEGAIINDVVADSPADRAGLQIGDVIQRYDGKRLASPAALAKVISLKKPGSKLRLSVLRQGRVKEVEVEIGTFPDSGPFIAGDAKARLGIAVEELTDRDARQLGYDEKYGVVVRKIFRNGPAAEAQLQEGDLILSINDRTVRTVEDFNRIVEALPKGARALLLVRHGRTEYFISLYVE